MNKIFTPLLITILFLGQFRVSAEPSQLDFLEVPEDLVESYEIVLDTIEANRKLIELQQSGIDSYNFLTLGARASLKSKLSDFSTELTKIDSDFRAPADDDFAELITSTKNKLTDYQDRLEELNQEQIQLITEEVYLTHLDHFKNDLRDLNLLMKKEISKDKQFFDLKLRIEIVEDHFVRFDEDQSESNWVRLEEKIRQLVETIDDLSE
jgi:hypothetical protein